MDLRTAATMWGTPVVQDDQKTPEAHLAMKQRMGERDGTFANRTAITSLTVQVKAWSTPRASDPEKAGPNMRGSKGDVPLPAQAVNWPTPAAQNHKGSSEGSSHRQDGKSRMDILHYRAEQGFRCLHPDLSTTAGPTSSPERRTLNPLFVEWLMGWPIGWTGSAPVETASSPWLQLMRGELLRLGSRKSRQISLFD